MPVSLRLAVAVVAVVAVVVAPVVMLVIVAVVIIGASANLLDGIRLVGVEAQALAFNCGELALVLGRGGCLARIFLELANPLILVGREVELWRHHAD